MDGTIASILLKSLRSDYCVAHSYPLPPDETERLAALSRLRIVGTPRTPDFDSLLALALQMSNCCAGVIGLMEGDRHWFKAVSGLDQLDIPRHSSLCNYTLLQTDPLIIEDLTRDPRFKFNPFVMDHGTRFYAGVALTDESGFKVGTLCVTDAHPRKTSHELVEMLHRLGCVAEALLAAHKQASYAMDIAEKASKSELNSWKKTRMFEQSQRLAKIGSWEMDVATRAFVLSEEAYRIHEMEVGSYLDLDQLRSRMSPELQAITPQLYLRCLATGEGYGYRGEFKTALGTSRWEHVVVDAEKRDGEVVRMFGTIRDVTDEHHASQAMWRAAHYDVLTGIPNRHYWTQRLDQAFQHAQQNAEGLTIFLLDLDGFKEINDTRGHAIGDAVLYGVAQRIRDTLPENSFHARLGGDEFAILIEKSIADCDVERLIWKLLAAIQQPIVIDHMHLQVSGTFGCASFPKHASTSAALMKNADIALYKAKRSHRSSFTIFYPDISGLFNERRDAIDLVAAAIDQNRLVPFYQPKVNLKTGHPAGFEALCRIATPDGKILGPVHFLPALEDPASVAMIGRAMLKLITADIAGWLAEGLDPGRVALNVAGGDFLDGVFADRVFARLADLALPATALEIEVTENTILGKEARMVSDALQAMRERGISIALDDFGTGFASLAHLRDAPIDYIKLDRSFISGLGHRADSAIIVRSIVDLGHSLGMRIVAEGIETNDQADFLRAIGCDEVQGFLFGRPMPHDSARLSLIQQAEHLALPSLQATG